MTRLSALQNQLNLLSLRKRHARRLVGIARLVVICCISLGILFVTDWVGLPGVRHRVVLQSIATVSIGVLTFTYILPTIRRWDRPVEIAIDLENQLGGRNDLVAALQFEHCPSLPGSKVLMNAVVENVAALSQSIKFNIQDDERRLRWPILATAHVVALSAASVAFPGHAKTFVNRMLLGSAHYPTRTQISMVQLNGMPLEMVGAKPEDARITLGQPVIFQVQWDGLIPNEGTLELSDSSNAQRSRLPLVRSKVNNRLFVGRIPRLLQTLQYRIILGDAYTELAGLIASKPVLLKPTLRVIPPKYARKSPEPETTSDFLNVEVLTGSSVQLSILAQNKTLADATLTVNTKPHAGKYALRSDTERPGHWTLPFHESPLRMIMEPISFSIQVTDHEGLKLEEPLVGLVRVRPDRPPEVETHADYRVILPSARPSVSFELDDDHGIANATLTAKIHRRNGGADSLTLEVPIPSAGMNQSLPIVGRFPFDIRSFNAARADRIECVLMVADYRGDKLGESTASRPITFVVGNQSDILTELGKTDRFSEQQLDEIIQRQFGLGKN